MVRVAAIISFQKEVFCTVGSNCGSCLTATNVQLPDAPLPPMIMSGRASPFCADRVERLPISSSRPRPSFSGRSIFLPLLPSRACFSPQALIRTSLLIIASLRAPRDSRMALLTSLATSMRSFGWTSSSSCGDRFSGGKISSAMVFSRSAKKVGFVGARGAR